MVNDSRFYYGVGLLIILISFVVFALGFEKRKPRAREIVILVCMISFAVIGRVIFYMTPQVKPCAAIIILTGAMTAFVSNFFMGQGPWTPWQMVAFGLLGYIFGIAYSKRNVGSYIPKKQKNFICFMGMLATIVVYGVIMDTATVLMSTDSPSVQAFITAYTAGFIMNVIHGISTFIFLWFMLIPMLKKIDRVNIKYGMYVK